MNLQKRTIYTLILLGTLVFGASLAMVYYYLVVWSPFMLSSVSWNA